MKLNASRFLLINELIKDVWKPHYRINTERNVPIVWNVFTVPVMTQNHLTEHLSEPVYDGMVTHLVGIDICIMFIYFQFNHSRIYINC